MQLNVRVQPKAKRNVIEMDGDRVVVRVTAAPEGGKANYAVVTLLAKKLGIAKGRITVVRGHKARDKRLEIQGIEAEEMLTRLSQKPSLSRLAISQDL
jgi:uncharacterized protein (TIGR00251 family)